MKKWSILLLCALSLGLAAYDFPVPESFLSALGGARTIQRSFAGQALQQQTDAPGAFAFSFDRSQSKYAGITIVPKRPLTLKPGEALLFDARAKNAPGGIYCRLYPRGNRKPAWSVNNWARVVGKEWTTFVIQQGGNADLGWEDVVVDPNAKPELIDRIQIIIGDHEESAAVYDLEITNFRIGKPIPQASDLTKPPVLSRRTDLTGQVTVLHPATPAGEAAAKTIAAELPNAVVRPGTAADRTPGAGNWILIGHVFNNPAMLPLYARYQAPADESYPGAGKFFLYPISEAFRRGQDVVVLGASDDAGLRAGAAELAKQLRAGKAVLDPALFVTNRTIAPAAEDHIANGLKTAQQRLDNGMHTSLGGYLSAIGQTYVQKRQSADAKLYAEVCRLYDKTSVPDARKFGGPWGFDSDFPSFQAISTWDIVEHDPILTDDDRLAVTRCLARWLIEAIVREASSGLNGSGSVHNHLTFCTQGTMAGALYFAKYYPELREPAQWMKIVRHNFGRQTTSTKAIDDCNGYQWLVWEHVMNFSNALPDDTFIASGTGVKVLRSMLLTMDNLGLQVPYGDTGSWKCWLSEIPVLQRYVAASDDPLAKYILARKREWGIRKAPNEYYCSLPAIQPPEGFSGVQKLELEPKFYANMNDAKGMPLEKCFDKVSFRDSFDPADFYLLIDGLNNGNHRHADGNSVLRHTLYNRIWLADNDYFKSQQKFHNTLLINANGESGAMQPYVELLGLGNDAAIGWYAGRCSDLVNTDWTRYVIWLKAENAYAALDVVRANAPVKLQLKQRWHSVGEVTPTADGAIFAQQGPAMRFQGFTSSRYALADDWELGANWGGYPHAKPVVRVLDQITDIPLAKGETARIGGVWHGAADGKIAPWRVVSTADGMTIDTGKTCYVISGDADGKLTVKTAASAGPAAEPAPQTAAADRSAGTEMKPAWESRQTVTSDNAIFWYTDHPQSQAYKIAITGTKPSDRNLLIPEAPNVPEALIDGTWASADDSCMLGVDQVGDWTVTFNQPLKINSFQLMSWWAHTSTRLSQHLIDTITVYADGKKIAEKDLSQAQLPNFGQTLPFRLTFPEIEATSVRMVLKPRPGSRLYPSEIRVGGPIPAGVDIPTIPCTAAADFAGDLLVGCGEEDAAELICFAPDGKIRWRRAMPDNGTIFDIAAADIDGDGKWEIALAGANHRLTVLNNDGSPRWHQVMEHYRVAPLVTLVRIADLDADGQMEVLAGCDNWRVYTFTADGKLLWHFEVIHPTRAMTPVDINGDGKLELLCGTKYYHMSALDHQGLKLWGANFGPGCRGFDAARNASGQIRVVAASDDGILRFFSNAGKPLSSFNTGDEIRHLAITPAAGAQTVWAGSYNGLLYQFDADGKLLNYTSVGSAVTAVCALPDGGALAGTADGLVFRFAADGKIVSRARLTGQITKITLTGKRAAAVTRRGQIATFDL